MSEENSIFTIGWLILAIWVAALPVSDEPPRRIGPLVAGLAGGLLGFVAGLVSVSMFLSQVALLSAAACGGVFVMASRRIATNRLRLLLVATVFASAGLASEFALWIQAG